jgi:hypothetical protein
MKKRATASKSTKRTATKKTTRKRTANAAAKKTTASTLAARMAEAKKLEAIDRADPKVAAKTTLRETAPTQRNSGYPSTYIKTIQVKLDDPDHPITLVWTGGLAAQQETGPFRASPGAGMRGLNCDNVATSRRSGSKCTPKGTHTVSGFQSRLNSDARATFVTWFVRERGIALHYFPSVPRYAASHGCVRIQEKRIAQLIQSNSRIGLTKVVIDGTWTKPASQW